MDLALSFNAPVVDTPKERRHVADTLNKIYLESMDNAGLGRLLKAHGGDPKDLGSLKRLQALLQGALPREDIGALLSPLYVLYDLRVAYSHLTTIERAQTVLTTVAERLEIAADASLTTLYETLVQKMACSYERLAELLSVETDAPATTC